MTRARLRKLARQVAAGRARAWPADGAPTSTFRGWYDHKVRRRMYAGDRSVRPFMRFTLENVPALVRAPVAARAAQIRTRAAARVTLAAGVIARGTAARRRHARRVAAKDRRRRAAREAAA